MEEKTKNVLEIFGAIVLTIFILGLVTFVFALVYSFSQNEYKTFEGEVTSYEVITENGEIKYFLLSFDNETPIKVYPNYNEGTLDFTVHSKMVVEFSRPTFWIFASDIYSVRSITKLPGGE